MVGCCSTVRITNDLSDVPGAQPYIKAVTTRAGPVYSTRIGTTIIHGLDLVGILVVPERSFQLATSPAVVLR